MLYCTTNTIQTFPTCVNFEAGDVGFIGSAAGRSFDENDDDGGEEQDAAQRQRAVDLGNGVIRCVKPGKIKMIY